MRRKLSIILAALALVVLATTGLILVYLSRLDPDELREPLAAVISQATGLDFEFQGPLEIELGLVPSLDATDLVVRNPRPGWKEPLARVERLKVEIELWRLLLLGGYQVRLALLKGVDLNLRVDESGAANWRGSPQTDPDQKPKTDSGVGIEILRAEVSDVAIRYHDAGTGLSVEGSLDDLTIRTDTESDAEQLTARGELRGERFSVEAKLARHALDRATAGGRSRMEARVVLPEGQLEVEGDAGGEELSRGLDLRVVAQLRTMSTVARWLDLPMRLTGDRVGPVRLKAHLLSEVGVVRLEDLEVEVGGTEGDSLALRGEVKDLFGSRTARLQARVRVADLDDVLERSELPVWGVGQVEASAELTHADATWKAADLKARLEHRDGATGDITGSLTESDGGLEFDVDVGLEAARVGELLQVFEPLLPELAEGAELPAWRRAWKSPLLESLAPVEAKGHLAGTLESARLSGLALVAGAVDGSAGRSIRASGEVRELLRGRGIELDIEVATADLHSLLEDLGQRALGLREATGRAHLSDAAGRFSLHGVALEAGRGDGLRISASGDVPDLTESRRLEGWKIALHARERADLEHLLDRSTRAWGEPIDLALTLDAVEGSRIEARDLMLQLGQSRFTGNVSATLDRAPRPWIEAKLQARAVRLSDMGVQPGNAGDADETGAAAPGETDDSIPFDALTRFDGSFTLAVGEVTGREGFQVKGADVEAVVRDGVLAGDGIRMHWDGGSVRATLRVDASRRPTEQSMRLVMQGADLADALAQLTTKQIAEGTLEISADLRSSGDTRGALLAGLQGDLFLHAYDGRVWTKYSKALQFDVLSQINPTLEVPEVEDLQCFVADFDIEGGRMNVSTILLDDSYTQVLASGWIDLPAGKLKLILTPVFKHNTRGSVAAVVHVQGSLGQPTVFVEPFATASAATRAAVSETLGGIGLVLPRVAKAVGGVLRVTGQLGEKSVGVGDLWTPDQDVSCELVLGQERIVRARALEAEMGSREPGSPR